jgi:transposase
MNEQSATKSSATPETATAKRTIWAWIPYERDQQLRFSCLDALIPEDDPVRLVDEVLASVDWTLWEAHYAPRRGQPPIHPRWLAAALLYGLVRGIHSSRKLEEACAYRFDFMWLVKGQRPDHTTFATFRVRFHDELKDLFKQLGRMAMAIGLIRLGEVAFDGTRVKANNSRYHTRTAATLEEKLEALESLFDQATCQTAAQDAATAELGSPTHLPEDLACLEQRREKLRAALAQARCADEVRRQQGVDPVKHPAQVPMTDPDSRVMSNKEGGYAPNYTPTAITDGHRGFILDCDVLAQVNETDSLPAAVDRIAESFGQHPEKLLTDAGNNSGLAIEAIEGRGIEFYAPLESSQPQAGNPARRDDPRQPVPESEWNQLPRNPQGQLDKACFVYDAENDLYYCPQGQPLPFVEHKPVRRGQVHVRRRVYRCAACAGCPLAAVCLSGKNKQGRTITRDQYEALRERIAARMAQPPARLLYNQRPRIAETTFGIIKSVMGLRQFLLRGLEKVKTEWRWAATALNLMKLARALGRLRARFAPLAMET